MNAVLLLFIALVVSAAFIGAVDRWVEAGARKLREGVDRGHL